MKTSIDIPDELLDELLDNTKADTKREAILTAIEDFVRKKKMASAADMIGTFDQFMSSDDLMKSRKSG